jgi:cell division protein FtsB
MRYNELMEQQKALEQTKQEMTAEKEELEELLDADGDESFIVRMARKFWGLFFPDEEIYFNNRNQ